MLRGTEVKLFGAKPSLHGAAPAGQILQMDRDGMLVACGEGAVRVAVVQPAGKRRLAPNEWASGRGAAVGDRFDVVPAAVG
jgi:methionyl-tRNA formyltransferase